MVSEVALVDERSGQALIEQREAELGQIRELFPGSMRSLDAFNRLVAAYAAAGRSIDELRTWEPDEAKRFFSWTLQGSNGHVYWAGSYSRSFKMNDGHTRKPVLWWWNHLWGEKPDRVQQVCGEAKCINPRHAVLDSMRGPKRIYPDHAIIGSLQVWAMQHGRSPSMREWSGPPSAMILKIRFGSWNNALSAAGLSLNPYKRQRTLAECVEAVRYATGLLGHAPSYDEFLALRSELLSQGLPTSHSTIRRVLGSWGAALEAARE